MRHLRIYVRWNTNDFIMFVVNFGHGNRGYDNLADPYIIDDLHIGK